MIAFVALNSSLRFSTLLIEGQCSSNPFKVKSIVTLKSLAFLFWKEKHVQEKQQSVQELIPPDSIYRYVYFVYIYKYIYAEI